MTVDAGVCNSDTSLPPNRGLVDSGQRPKREADARKTVHAVALQFAVAPLFAALYAPLLYRRAPKVAGSREQTDAAWREVVSTYDALGLDVDISGFAPGAGEATVTARAAARSGLHEALAAACKEDTVKRWTAHRASLLVDAYYARADKSQDQPLARQVLTAKLQPALTAVFGGDWLTFLAFVGETANAAEQIVTALPEPRIYVETSAKAASAAAATGLRG